MPRQLPAGRPMRRLLVTVLAVTLQWSLGLLVMVLRTVRVIVTLPTAIAMHAEQQLAARTGRQAISQTGIGAITAAFVHEFKTAYNQPTR